MPSASFKFSMKGTRELEQALMQLPKSASKTVLRNSLKKIATPIAVDASRRAPRSANPPHLADSVTVSTKLKRSQRGVKRSGVTVYVGARMPHAHLVEFGTAPRSHKSGKSVGHMPADPFLRPAWDAHKRGLLRDLGDLLWEEILKTSKRLARRSEKYRAKAAAKGIRL